MVAGRSVNHQAPDALFFPISPRGTIAAMPPRDGFHRQVVDPKPPRSEDAVPENMCLSCGVVSRDGQHESLKDCVDALRDVLARRDRRAEYRQSKSEA
jgi:hypothetical protein